MERSNLKSKISVEARASIDADGFYHLPEVSHQDFEEICQSLGKELMRTSVTVKHENERGPLVVSAKELGLHTDHHGAKYIGWFCHKHDQTGGVSILSDSHAFINELTECEIEELKNIQLFEHDISGRGKPQCKPLLSDNGDGSYPIYFSYWLSDKRSQEMQVFKKFVRLANSNIKSIHLQKNSCLIVDNHRVMHGRTKINDPTRNLERIWIC